VKLRNRRPVINHRRRSNRAKKSDRRSKN